MFFKTPLFKVFIFSLIIVLAMHFIAANFYLYWQFLWFDLIVHVFGGFSVGVFFSWLLYNLSFLKRNFFLTHFIFVSIIFSFIIAVLWEIFELYFGIIVFSGSYTLDTTLDILFGVIGGIWGSTYSFNVIKKGKYGL